MHLKCSSLRLFNYSFSYQKLAFVDVATGSLGQGLGAACGMAYTGKHFDKARSVFIEFFLLATLTRLKYI